MWQNTCAFSNAFAVHPSSSSGILRFMEVAWCSLLVESSLALQVTPLTNVALMYVKFTMDPRPPLRKVLGVPTFASTKPKNFPCEIRPFIQEFTRQIHCFDFQRTSSRIQNESPQHLLIFASEGSFRLCSNECLFYIFQFLENSVLCRPIALFGPLDILPKCNYRDFNLVH